MNLSINWILILCFIMGCIGCSTQKEKQKTILVALAHPDDETAFAAVLAKHARLGDKVYLILAVDARFHTQYISGSPDSVAMVKQQNAICSCQRLGIEKPIFYSFNSMDRKHGAKDGVRDAVEAGSQFREKLKQSIIDLKPNLLLTFGPDGEYGHPEHIIVSSLVTELLLREGWVDQYPLYYFGLTKLQEGKGDGWLRYVDDPYLNVKVTYTEADEQKAAHAIQCYTSGFSQIEMKEMIDFEHERPNELFFRRFKVANGLTDDFLKD